MVRMTEEEYRQIVSEKNKEKGNPSSRPKPKKYRNVLVYIYEDGFESTVKVDGHGNIKDRFDSIKEYQRFLELQLLERTHKISNLQKQVPLIVFPAFVSKDGAKHRAIVYKADFVYEENGREVVEDVKAYSKAQKKYLCTEAFLLKWKILQGQYPDKEFRIY